MPDKITNLLGVDSIILQATISGYTDEAYTNAKKLSGTAIVGGNPNIDTGTETYVGQVRWHTPSDNHINIVDLTNAATGTKTKYAADFLNYVKTVRTHGGEKADMASVITQEDGLAKIGRDFGETRAQDEHNAILAVCKGVAISEALYGAGIASGNAGLGGQTFENDPTDKKYGFYVDLGSAKPVVASSATTQGAARAEGFLNAFGMAYKDYEPDFAYLVVSPLILASLRSANLVDQTTVTEGNVTFSTIFGGKFRLIPTRANQGLTSAELAKINTMGGVDIVGTYTSFIILPGAIALEALSVPNPVGIQHDENAYNGSGMTSLWHRWGYVAAPAGYDWLGNTEAFPGDADYMKVLDTTPAPDAFTTLATATNATIASGTWGRKTKSALSLGILPVFHS
jgi:hypothetical protein